LKLAVCIDGIEGAKDGRALDTVYVRSIHRAGEQEEEQK